MNQHKAILLPFLLFSLLAVVLGGIMLFRPKLYKRLWLWQSKQAPTFARFNPFMSPEFVETSMFSIMTAVGGVILLLYGVFGLYGVLSELM
jgi:hypothetical protein